VPIRSPAASVATGLSLSLHGVRMAWAAGARNATPESFGDRTIDDLVRSSKRLDEVAFVNDFGSLLSPPTGLPSRLESAIRGVTQLSHQFVVRSLRWRGRDVASCRVYKPIASALSRDLTKCKLTASLLVSRDAQWFRMGGYVHVRTGEDPTHG
jgi:hypothetical protein